MNQSSLNDFIRFEKVEELVSALQKRIRRQMPSEAMVVAWKLGLVAPKALWSRALIISNEDVPDAEVILAVDTLHRQFKDAVSKGKKENDLDLVRLGMIAAKLLAEIPKDRRADEFFDLARLNVMTASRTAEALLSKDPKMEKERRLLLSLGMVHDYDLDKHTSEGRKMGRGDTHWVTVASICNNKNPDYVKWRAEWEKLMLEAIEKKQSHELPDSNPTGVSQ